MVVCQGEIWWVELPSPVGSEPGYNRPVIVVQADSFNRSLISTVIAVVLTSNISRAQAPGNVLLSRNATGLPKDSVANITQIITLDKAAFVEKTGKLPDRKLAQVHKGIRLALGIS